MIHGDLHSGNILIDSESNVTIGDLGLNLGVIPYIAPELFNGEKYIKATDIYSFGMIMWEMTTGQKPFSDQNHDGFLILDILNGHRTNIIANTPKCYVELMEKCWDDNPFLRPDAMNICNHLVSFYENKQDFLEKMEIPPIRKTNPRAIYTSQPLSSSIHTASNYYTDALCAITDEGNII
ncbi:1555_t:CDS:2 [Racocetra fulgida]|uniref:1555_t:CDS:1 n=1 Tax=Racocetra fulgida TaxID=60492 RepID=A0A9N8ZSF9_9GLOM|nr:1555_t:CDS:2 [Racocetra fulgida]